MKVLLTGATGFVGSRLSVALRGGGHEVETVSRGSGGDYDWSDDALERAVEANEAIIHLAGEPIIGKRWSAVQKTKLRDSRVDTTRKLATLAAQAGANTLLCASAIGYYGPRDDRPVDESASPGDDFLSRLCVDWEQAVRPARDGGVRVASVRIGVALGEGGGALAKMLPPFRMGVGGPIGSGRQVVSWIHLDDLVRLFVFLLERSDLAGAFNGTAPHAVTMKELSRELGRALHRPAIFPVPGFVLKVALGEASLLLLTGQRVLPTRTLDAGFEFRYPEVDAALESVLGR